MKLDIYHGRETSPENKYYGQKGGVRVFAIHQRDLYLHSVDDSETPLDRQTLSLKVSVIHYCCQINGRTSKKYNIYKKLSCHREAARCFVSLNISLNHSRSIKVIRNHTLDRACASPYY